MPFDGGFLIIRNHEVGDTAGRYHLVDVEIDELLVSGDSSIIKPNRSKVAANSKPSEAPSDDYEQEFDEYEETRKLETVSYRSDFHAESNTEWKRPKNAYPARENNSTQQIE